MTAISGLIAEWEVVLILVALLGAAVSAGAFFTFSNFVMPSLARLPAAGGVSAMQAINEAAPNPLFVAAIVGAGALGLPVLIAGVDDLGAAAGGYLLVGVALSLLSFVITVILNVPRNNALARLDPGAASTEAEWHHYLRSWTRANTLRTLTSLASVAAYGLSLATGWIG